MAAELHGNSYCLKQNQLVCVRHVDFGVRHQTTGFNHGNVLRAVCKPKGCV
jgi:hypothetical protein